MDSRAEFIFRLAKSSIEHGLLHDEPMFINPSSFADNWFLKPVDTFVTLTYKGKTRGCIGSTLTPIPLFRSILLNAFRSGFQDPRFSKVNRNVLAECSISVSILHTVRGSWKMTGGLPGFIPTLRDTDSLVLTNGNRSATMLSCVQATSKSKAEFVELTREKAGIPRDISWNDIVATLIETDEMLERPYGEIECL